MAEGNRYHFETFQSPSAEFDSKFSEYVNSKYDSGWKYKDCHFSSSGDQCSAYCLFKRKCD